MLQKSLPLLFVLLFLTYYSAPAMAADLDNDSVDDSIDIDKDGNGLIEISTLTQLYNIRNNLAGSGYNDGSSNNSTGCGNGTTILVCSGYELVNDLDFDANKNSDLSDDPYWNSGDGWEPIGSTLTAFSGTFEGNGYTIANLFINRPTTDDVGFFAALDGAEIRNVSFTGDLLSVTGKSRVAILSGNKASSNESKFSGLSLAGSVFGNRVVGAIQGRASLFSITDSHASTMISATNENIGGFIGLGGDSDVSLISGSSFSGSVSGTRNVGGLVGEANSVKVVYSYATGSVTGSDNYVGGIFGASVYPIIENSFVTASVHAGIRYAGGLIGYGDTATISNSFTSGAITSLDYSAGLIAYSEYGLVITNSFATGTIDISIEIDPDSGGIVADLDPEPFTESNVYWDIESTGQTTSANDQGVGYTTAELQTPTTNSGIYEGWSTLNWDFGSSSEYPALILNGNVYRDADNDGYWAFEDAFDNDPNEHLDSDKDNVGDNSDAFPNNPNEWADFDLDGIGDNTDLDDDNDGVEDAFDDFPYNAGRTDIDALDTDNDDIDDNLDVDIDGDGLIEIRSLVALNNIRNNLSGTSYNDGYSDSSKGCGNNSSVLACSGYELANSLNFDENGDKSNNDRYNSGEGWVPIGDRSAPFTATFDGNNFKLLNLYINNTSLSNENDTLGLFGETNRGTIRNLHIQGSISGSAYYLGSFVGYAVSTTMSNVSFIGDINSTQANGSTGGIAGKMDYRSITECVAIVELSAQNDAGGITGDLLSSRINNCLVTGNVESPIGSTAGGIAGSAFDSTITNVISHANIKANNAAGGLIGNLSGLYSNVIASISTGRVTGSFNNGGVLGSGGDLFTMNAYWDTDTSNLSVSDGGVGYSTSELQAPTNASGIYNNWDTDYWDFGSSTQYPTVVINGVLFEDTDDDGTPNAYDDFPDYPYEDTDSDQDGVGDNSDAFPNDPTETSDLDGDSIGDNSDPDIDGDGVENEADFYPLDATGVSPDDDVDLDDDGLIELYTLDDLDAMRNDLTGTSFNGRTAGCAGSSDGTGCLGYELMADLDFDSNGDADLSDEAFYNDGEGWIPLGSLDARFSATFDGNGHTISNLFINRPDSDYQALFGYVKNIKVRNLNIGGELTSVTGLNNSAMLIARNSGSYTAILTNVNVSGQVLGNDDSGLVAGRLYNLTANQVHAKGDITAISVVDSDGEDDAGSDVGGLFGQLSNSSTLNFVSFQGNIQGTNSAGGLIGDAEGVNINDSYAHAYITLIDDTGIELDLNNAGGLIGSAEGTNTLSRVFALGEIQASSNVGGLIGHVKGATTITDAKSNVELNGESELGGIVGNLDADSSFVRVLAHGLITSSDGLNTNVGGILGYSADSNLSYNYALWDREAVGVDTTFASGGASYSTEELQCPQTPFDGVCGSTAYTNDWSTDVWNFGTAEQYPAIVLNSIVYRDTDKDGYWEYQDLFDNDPTEHSDFDNDGTGDNSDAFPTDPNETVDSDNDGTGDNADAFPTDPTETADSDSDGTGDNADAFPTDPTEAADSDNDGTGDNADAFPTDPTETADSDNDGTGDNSDAFPTNPNETVDSDNDGIGNNEDTDDDNDGIPDVEDNNPLTPDEPIVVDTQAPVIGELIGVTFEATGKLTSIELPAPSVTDDMDENPSIVSTSTSDLSLGEHVVTWTASDVSGNQSTATQLVTIVDATAPEFDVVETLTINAAGRITNISSLLTVFANDLVDGELRATINGDTRLESGAHQVEMVATDASGNSSVNVTDVSILPSVATSSVNFVSPNLQLEVPVVLSGHAPNYPVSVRYEFTHNGQVIDGGSIDITASVNGSIALTVPDEVQPSDTLSLTLQEATNAFIGEHNSVMMVVVSDNKAPRLDIGMSQNGKAVSVIDIDAGMVDIVATVSDTNSIDTHTVNWVSLDGQLADMSNSTSYQIDPDALQPGLYLLQATAIENNTEQALSVTHSIQLFVEQLAELSSDNDADDDGVGDADEGFGDVDGDGIADYLDADDAVNTLPSALNAQPLHVSAANGLALGGYVTALYRNNATHASFPIDMLAALVSDGDADVSDINYVPLTPVYNFVISDGFEAGDSVSVVIPMVQDFTLPASAMYRKYSASEGWFNFVEDARNSLSSAAADVNGNCPTVNDGAYTPGLSEGDNCIQLTIEDGGPNDTDNAINASIEDPGLVVVQSDVLVPVIELIDYLEVSERNQVRIDASNSYDLADAALSFKWQQLTGDDIDLGDTQQSELLFTAPEVIDDTLLTFEVIVSNGELSSRAEVSVLVKQVNQAPVVSVETEQSEAMEGEIIQLFANAIDSDADALVYHWQQVSGTAATFEDSATEMLEVTLPQVTAEETLQFQVTVSDGEYSVTAIMEVTVYNQADPASPVEPKTVESGGSLGWILFVLYAVTSLRRSRKKYTA
ncbi:beta strand repeat-containing protein [Paraferrimonas haliotis]|uniref:beta strand repeat-containing protein n=1 Tax=Paraferrimonas haliotis TaxID=2013866 RepID=UPI000BA90100|nr:hypothetical protein [Paraferrimonas haliotis]